MLARSALRGEGNGRTAERGGGRRATCRLHCFTASEGARLDFPFRMRSLCVGCGHKAKSADGVKEAEGRNRRVLEERCEEMKALKG